MSDEQWAEVDLSTMTLKELVHALEILMRNLNFRLQKSGDRYRLMRIVRNSIDWTKKP